MIYACEDCGFLFYRAGEVKACPACDKSRLRPANQEEIIRLQSFLTKLNAKEEKNT